MDRRTRQNDQDLVEFCSFINEHFPRVFVIAGGDSGTWGYPEVFDAMVQRNRIMMFYMGVPNTLGLALYRNMTRHTDGVHFAKTPSNVAILTRYIKEAVTLLFAFQPEDS